MSWKELVSKETLDGLSIIEVGFLDDLLSKYPMPQVLPVDSDKIRLAIWLRSAALERHILPTDFNWLRRRLHLDDVSASMDVFQEGV